MFFEDFKDVRLILTDYIPVCSIYGIFTYIYHGYQANVGKHAIHGWYGYSNLFLSGNQKWDAIFL